MNKSRASFFLTHSVVDDSFWSSERRSRRVALGELYIMIIYLSIRIKFVSNRPNTMWPENVASKIGYFLIVE